MLARVKCHPVESQKPVSVCQIAALARLHIHPSCYHAPAVDKAAFGPSWSCHHHTVGLQDNRAVQLLPALSLPTMARLCCEWSGKSLRSQRLSLSSRLRWRQRRTAVLQGADGLRCLKGKTGVGGVVMEIHLLSFFNDQTDLSWRNGI